MCPEPSPLLQVRPYTLNPHLCCRFASLKVVVGSVLLTLEERGGEGRGSQNIHTHTFTLTLTLTLTLTHTHVQRMVQHACSYIHTCRAHQAPSVERAGSDPSMERTSGVGLRMQGPRTSEESGARAAARIWSDL
jgi:hypothetical protein